jgi:hypothetical protein
LAGSGPHAWQAGQPPQSIAWPQPSVVMPHWAPSWEQVFATHPSGPASATPLDEVVEEDELLVVEDEPGVVLVAEVDELLAEVVLVTVVGAPCPPEPDPVELSDRVPPEPPEPVAVAPWSSTALFEHAAITATGSNTTSDVRAVNIEARGDRTPVAEPAASRTSQPASRRGTRLERHVAFRSSSNGRGTESRWSSRCVIFVNGREAATWRAPAEQPDPSCPDRNPIGRKRRPRHPERVAIDTGNDGRVTRIRTLSGALKHAQFRARAPYVQVRAIVLRIPPEDRHLPTVSHYIELGGNAVGNKRRWAGHPCRSTACL